jgi:hypothetical protein
MLITESIPSTRISIQVDWVKPFVALNVNDFVLDCTGPSTRSDLDNARSESLSHEVMGIFVNRIA